MSLLGQSMSLTWALWPCTWRYYHEFTFMRLIDHISLARFIVDHNFTALIKWVHNHSQSIMNLLRRVVHELYELRRRCTRLCTRWVQSSMRLLHLVVQGHHSIINHKVALSSMSAQLSMNLLHRVVHELHELGRCAQGSNDTINNKPASSLIMSFVSPYKVSSIH